jgi:PIN domain nuclease of toxin-antitoxin system
MVCVLDASAMLALVRDEGGAEVVEALLADTENTCYAHVVNLCEVYYDHVRIAGEAAAQTELGELAVAGVNFRADIDTDFWQAAGRHKTALRRVSLAECFCIALAVRVNGELLTGDHHEFDRIVPLGLCPVRFIR